ncbi:MAG: DJ-1/PfpI family protein [Pseudomonadota bacterium]
MIGFLAFDGVEELDLVGPWEMARMWHAYADGPQAVTVAARAGLVRCAKGLGLVADHGFDDCPRLTALVVPGGFAALDLVDDQAVVAFIRKQGAACDHMLSVCTGSFLLAAAGLLEGRHAATHWKAREMLAARGVEVSAARFVRDGNVWTSGGVSAGMDLMLHFIAETAGEEAAAITQHNAEYYPDGRIYGALHQADGMPGYMSRLGRS